jgi:hypothetical protein
VNKQLVNLIGAAASLLIIVLGVAVFALPLFSAANTTAASADDVARQNRTQQTVLDTLTAQSADMTSLDRTVAELRAEVPAAPHLDDVLLLAVQAAVDEGGVVTSVTPATAEPFASRTGETEEPSSAATEETTTGTDETAETPAPAASPAAAADEQQQISVTVVVEAGDVAAATRILDGLREGPRVAAVTQAAVTSETEDEKVTLTVALLVFFRP